MNRAERRARMRRRIGRAALALLAAATLALSPLSEDMALAAATDDLTVYGGGGGGGGSTIYGGGGGGYVRYGDSVEFGGGGGEFGRGGGVGDIQGSGSGGLGDGGKVGSATGTTGVNAIRDTISDFDDVETSSGFTKNAGSSKVTMNAERAIRNFVIYGGNGGSSGAGVNIGGSGGDATFDSAGYTLTLHGNLTVASGKNGERFPSAGGGGKATFKVRTLVAAQSGAYKFEKHDGALAVTIDTLKVQADTTLSFEGTKLDDLTLGTICLDGGVLTINDDTNLSGKSIVVASGNGDTTLLKAGGGKNLSGAVNVSATGVQANKWEVDYEGGTESYSASTTTINLNLLNKPTVIRAVVGPINNPPPAPPPAPTGFTVSASANPAQGGSVSGGGSYISGSTATLQATANSGYAFTGWTVNGAAMGSANPMTLTITADIGVVANFEEVYTGEENTYPDPVNGSQTATIGENGVAVVSLMADNARKIVGEITPQSKGIPGSRVARLNANTGKATSIYLRMSAAGLQVLKNARIAAFEVRSGAADIYLDKQMLDTIYAAAARTKGTYRIIVRPAESAVSVTGDLGEKNPQQKGKGLLTIRLPLDKAVVIEDGFYDSQKKELILAPESFGSFTLTGRAESKHWAADYMAFAKISGKPDDAYKDKAGKTYTRAEFAQKLYDELAEDDALPQAMRAAYPFKDAASRAAVVLQQAGIVSPLSTGLFNGDAALTNAQASAWLARLDWLDIDPLSPYGWAFSDDGVSMYYGYTGKMAVGKETLGGKTYTFDKDGFLTE